jgi:hypothetical protein
MMSIVGPPSDIDIKHMKCSDVMAPMLANYVGRVRKANSLQQQHAFAAAASPDQQQQQQQQQQQHQHGISPKLRLKFKGASDVLLLMLQRLLSFDPEVRISAGDAFVELLASATERPSGSPASSAGAVAAVSPGSSASTPRHPIDSTLEGGHKGLCGVVFGTCLYLVTLHAAALKTVNDIMRRRCDLNLDIGKKPCEQLEECLRLLMNEVADVNTT